MARKNIDMCNGALYKNLWIYTFPIMLTGILSLLFNAADLIVVGRFCGKLSVAAVGATNALSQIIVNLFAGFSVGVSVTVAQAIGAKNKDEIHKAVHTAIPTALICGLILMAIGLIFSDTLLKLTSTPNDIIKLSSTYLKIYFCGMPFSLLYNYGAAVYRASGDSKTPLIFLATSGIVNVILNIFFVTVFNMNVAGVALATAISQGLSAFLVLRGLIKRNDDCKFIIKDSKIYKNCLFKILGIGFPAGLQSSLFAISNTIIQASVNSFGSIAISGNAAASSIEGFVYVGMDASSNTCLNFTGANYGASNLDRIKKVALYTSINTTISGFVLGFGSFLIARPLLSIYLGNATDAIEYGVTRMFYIGILYFICGVMNTVGASMRGIGKSQIPLIITLLGACGLRILWIFTVFQIPAYHTLPCLFLSWPISWTITTLAEIPFLLHYYKNLKKRFAKRNI